MEQHRKGIEEWNALSPQEKIAKSKERLLPLLLKIEYITPEEAEKAKSELTSLPTDTKELVLAYLFRGLFDWGSYNPLEFCGAFKPFHDATNLAKQRSHGILSKPLAAYLSEAELSAMLEEGKTERTKYEVARAETFVASKRRRLRNTLLKLMRVGIADILLHRKPYDNAYYLYEQLKPMKYRRGAKNLTDKDKEAVEVGAHYYLDLLELAFLNGTGDAIIEHDDKFTEDGVYTEDIYDENATEEAMRNVGYIYVALISTLLETYNDNNGQLMAEVAKNIVNVIIPQKVPNESEEIEAVGKSKFAYLLSEIKDVPKIKVSPLWGYAVPTNQEKQC